MINRSLNKVQLLIFLLLLTGLSISMTYAQPAENTAYQQWKAEQQQQDLRLKPVKGGDSNHYLSKPALSPASSGQKIRLNSANVAELQQLNGIGQKKAEAVVSYRQKHGKFTSIEQIQEIKGIGPAIFAKNKDRLAL